MSRIASKLFTALFVLGNGSGAMASPNHGQWTDNSGGDQNQPSQGSYPSQGGYPSQGSYPSQGGYPSQGYPPPSGSQDQGSAQPPDQDQEEDIAETEGQEANQNHLGIVVMAVTPELRRFFGVASDRGVLIARVEPGSAAARAGIQVGDVLVRVGPQVVHAGDEVVQALAARQGGRLRILVVRQGRPIHLVAFATAPNSQAPSTPGNPQGIPGNPQGIPGNQQNPPPPGSSQNQL